MEIPMYGPIIPTNFQKCQTFIFFLCITSIINVLIPVINYVICKFHIIPPPLNTLWL